MTHPAEEKLAAIVAGLDGVTPGPWDWELHDISAASLSGPRGINGGDHVLDVSPCENCQKHAKKIGIYDWKWGLCSTPTSETAAHIARCDPDTMREIAARMAELKAERESERIQIKRLENCVDLSAAIVAHSLGERLDEQKQRAETAERERDAALAECERQGQALAQCAEWFDAYRASHHAKGDTDKAKRNQDRADFARAALTKKEKP